MTSWNALAQELDAWGAAGLQPTLWWRDDDACSESEALRRMLGIAQRQPAPLTLAVIPAALEPSLVEAVAHCDAATVVQHGYAHRNHAPSGERSAELGNHRPIDVCLAELAQGRDRLVRSFDTRFVSVLVPPWNRIGVDIAAALSRAGYGGLSCFGPRAGVNAASGVVQVNTHVDLIAWRRGRIFIGREAAIERLVAHLRARRCGEADATEPTGLLTHHLVTPADAWDFVEELLQRTRAHGTARWLDTRSAFDPRLTCVRSA